MRGLFGSIERSMAAGVLVAKEDALPGLAAIARAIDAALLVRAMRVTERGDVDEIGILRVDAHLADVARLREAAVRPGLAAVGGLVDAVAVRDVAANRRLAHADVDHVAGRTPRRRCAPTEARLKKPSETFSQ